MMKEMADKERMDLQLIFQNAKEECSKLNFTLKFHEMFHETLYEKTKNPSHPSKNIGNGLYSPQRIKKEEPKEAFHDMPTRPLYHRRARYLGVGN